MAEDYIKQQLVNICEDSRWRRGKRERRNVTVPQVLGVNHWAAVAAVVAFTLLFWRLDRYEAAGPALKLQKRTGQEIR